MSSDWFRLFHTSGVIDEKPAAKNNGESPPISHLTATPPINPRPTPACRHHQLVSYAIPCSAPSNVPPESFPPAEVAFLSSVRHETRQDEISTRPGLSRLAEGKFSRARDMDVRFGRVPGPTVDVKHWTGDRSFDLNAIIHGSSTTSQWSS
jgi:hypothetical protein